MVVGLSAKNNAITTFKEICPHFYYGHLKNFTIKLLTQAVNFQQQRPKCIATFSLVHPQLGGGRLDFEQPCEVALVTLEDTRGSSYTVHGLCICCYKIGYSTFFRQTGPLSVEKAVDRVRRAIQE